MYEMVEESDMITLFLDASSLLKAYNSTGDSTGEIPKDLWPESIRILNPQVVRTFHGGILLRTHIDERYEIGIFFDLESPESQPGDGSGEIHSPIANGIYATEIKIRPPMKLKKLQVDDQ